MEEAFLQADQVEGQWHLCATKSSMALLGSSESSSESCRLCDLVRNRSEPAARNAAAAPGIPAGLPNGEGMRPPAPDALEAPEQNDSRSE